MVSLHPSPLASCQVLLDAIVQACKLNAEKEEWLIGLQGQRRAVAPMRPPCAPPHVKCRTSMYPGYQRVQVSDTRVKFDVAWPEYDEQGEGCMVKVFDAEDVRAHQGDWADPPLSSSGRIKDALLGTIKERKTLIDTPAFGERVEKPLSEAVEFDPLSRAPLNPRGRTGLRGRGKLGRWGARGSCTFHHASLTGFQATSHTPTFDAAFRSQPRS